MKRYYREDKYGIVFVLTDKEVKKLIGVVKTTKRNNTMKKRIKHILLKETPNNIYKRIVEDKSDEEIERIHNLSDNEKLNKLKEEIQVLDYIFARNVFLKDLKEFLTDKTTKFFFKVIMKDYGISEDESSNSEENDEDLFPNTISDINGEYKTSIVTKKELRKNIVKVFKDIGRGTINDIRNQLLKRYKVSKNLKLDAKVLAQYLRGHYEPIKPASRSKNTVYVAK